MRKTKALYGKRAREALIRGMDAVYNAVAPTMGARGRNVIYQKWGTPLVTNDGVSIAREIIPEDPYEYLGAEALKQAAEQTNFEAGDGTSSTIVLGRSLVTAGTKLMEDNNYNPMVLRREMEAGRDKVIAALKTMSTEVTDLKQVARISVENEELALMVAETVEKVGVDGSIVVEETHGTNVRAEVVQGYTWNLGYVSPYMANTAKGEAVLDKCAVIVTDKYMNLNSDLFAVLEQLLKSGQQSVLVIADNVEGELLQTLFANKKKNVMTVVVVKKPETKEELEDLAILTGATAVTGEKGITTIGMSHVGMAERVVVSHNRTIIVNTATADAIKVRADEVREQIKAEDQEKYGLIEVLEKRLSRLVGGVARIKVGAQTEAEQAYLKMKIDDAVGACQSALAEGVVAGGGTTLRDLTLVLNNTIPGEVVLISAMMQPYLTILYNAGIDIDEYNSMTNYDVLTGEIIYNMVDAGIVDPTKVVRCALKNAVSFAAITLTTEAAIADIPVEPEKVVPGQH